MKPFKLISLLLQYPEADLYAARNEIAAAAKALPKSRSKSRIEQFLEHWRTTPLMKLQRGYVETFDFDKRASLYLSFHGYGDRRQRGMAMVRLKNAFAASGLPLNEGELPDYLPVLLEYAALAPKELGLGALGELRAEIELVRSRLHDRNSPYAALLDAVSSLLGHAGAEAMERVRRLATGGPPVEEVGLEPFGPPEAMPSEAICEVATPTMKGRAA